MDSKGECRKGGEITMSDKRNIDGIEVIVNISTEGDAKAVTEGNSLKGSPSKEFETATPKQTRVDSPHQSLTESSTGVAESAPKRCPSPEITSFSPTQNEPSESPNANEALLVFEEEPNASLQEQVGGHSPFENSFKWASPGPAGGGDGEEDDENIYKKAALEWSQAKHKRIKTKGLVQWTVFFLILGCLVASSTVDQLKASKLWGLEMWKWCVLVMVLFSGMLVTNWVMHFIVLLIERKFLLREKVIYFVHGLKKSIQVFTWLAFVLLTWVLLFNQGAKRSKTANKLLDYITWTLVSILIGSFLWLLKTLLLKLALRFYVTTFFDQIQELNFHQYVLWTLFGPPLLEEAERIMGKEKKVIDMGKIYRIIQEKVWARTIKMLTDAVKNSGPSVSSFMFYKSIHYGGAEQAYEEKTTKMEAMAAAFHIFRNVAQPGCRYFDQDDLQRFMMKEEVDLFFPFLDEEGTGRIYIRSLSNWVEKVYHSRKELTHALADKKKAVGQLDNLVTGILIVITIIIWLLLMEIATTNVLVLLSSQFVMAAFVFGNACKTMFEGIIFVIVRHPFDVGDLCLIDGVQLMVEEINISSTVFLTLDNELINYPNSVLATKPIINYRRSPDGRDKVEFSIEFTTPSETIESMKERIKKYLEKNPQHWHPNHDVFVSEIENLNKIKMGLHVYHTMNFQDYAEKNRRRTELLLELKRIFDDLNIRYDLLPREVHPLQSEDKKEA